MKCCILPALLFKGKTENYKKTVDYHHFS